MRWYFSWVLVDSAVELVTISKCSVEEMVGVFFDSENDVRMVTV